MRKIFKYLLFAFVCVMTLTATASVITVVTLKKNNHVNTEEAAPVVEPTSNVVEEPDVEPIEEPEEVVVTDYVINNAVENNEITKESVASQISNKSAVKILIIQIANNEEVLTIRENAFEGFTGLEEVRFYTKNLVVESNAFVDSDNIYVIRLFADTVINENAIISNTNKSITYTYENKTDEVIVNRATLANIIQDRINSDDIVPTVYIFSKMTNIKIEKSSIEIIKNAGYICDGYISEDKIIDDVEEIVVIDEVLN